VNLKFNPSSNMQHVLAEMLKYDSTITITNYKDNQQIQLNTEAILTNETEFTKYFMVTQDTHPANSKPHIIIGCWIMSNRPIRDIKFDMTMQTKLIDWLKKEHIFLKSDSLGITKSGNGRLPT